MGYSALVKIPPNKKITDSTPRGWTEFEEEAQGPRLIHFSGARLPESAICYYTPSISS